MKIFTLEPFAKMKCNCSKNNKSFLVYKSYKLKTAETANTTERNMKIDR